MPEPTIRAVGVASPRAHGHAITKTEIATPIDLLKSFEIKNQFTNARTDIASITGTNMPVILSASFCIGIFVPCASSTNFIICARKVSFPIFVALT